MTLEKHVLTTMQLKRYAEGVAVVNLVWVWEIGRAHV